MSTKKDQATAPEKPLKFSMTALTPYGEGTLTIEAEYPEVINLMLSEMFGDQFKIVPEKVEPKVAVEVKGFATHKGRVTQVDESLSEKTSNAIKEAVDILETEEYKNMLLEIMQQPVVDWAKKHAFVFPKSVIDKLEKGCAKFGWNILADIKKSQFLALKGAGVTSWNLIYYAMENDTKEALIKFLAAA